MALHHRHVGLRYTSQGTECEAERKLRNRVSPLDRATGLITFMLRSGAPSRQVFDWRAEFLKAIKWLEIFRVRRKSKED